MTRENHKFVNEQGGVGRNDLGREIEEMSVFARVAQVILYNGIFRKKSQSGKENGATGARAKGLADIAEQISLLSREVLSD